MPDKPQNDPPERPPSPLMVEGTGRPDALNGFAVTFNPIRTPRAFEVICDQIRERLLAGDAAEAVIDFRGGKMLRVIWQHLRL